MIIFCISHSSNKERALGVRQFGQAWVDLRAGEAAVIAKASSEYRI